jgi:hypothetical protein
VKTPFWAAFSMRRDSPCVNVSAIYQFSTRQGNDHKLSYIYIPRPKKEGGVGFEHFEFIFLRSIYLSHALSLLIKLFRLDQVVMVTPR